MKRNDKIKLQLHIDSSESTKNKETGAIEIRKRYIGNSLNVVYVIISSYASTDDGHGCIVLRIKYAHVAEEETVYLNDISINVIEDIYNKLVEVLLLNNTTNDDLYRIRDVKITQTHDEVVITYKDKGSDIVQFEFDKMNTTDCIQPRIRS